MVQKERSITDIIIIADTIVIPVEGLQASRSCEMLLGWIFLNYNLHFLAAVSQPNIKPARKTEDGQKFFHRCFV